MPDGRLLHPNEVVVNLLRHAERWVAQYQLTQETRERIVLRIAPLGPPPPEDVTAIESHARAVLGPGVEFQLLLVPEIPFEPNGKFRISRSLVRSIYDEVDWERRRAEDLASLARRASGFSPRDSLLAALDRMPLVRTGCCQRPRALSQSSAPGTSGLNGRRL